MEKMTIRELAEALGCSKAAIRKHMTEEFRAKYTETAGNGVITIVSEGCAIIAETMGKKWKLSETIGNQFPETDGNQVSGDEIAFLKEQIRAKDELIKSQQEQITNLTTALANTTASLQAAQALHAGTMGKKMLSDGETKKSRWKFWEKS